MIESSVVEGARKGKGDGRRQRSPQGMWQHLEWRYWRGDLGQDDAERFEDLHRYLLALYREAGR